MRGLGGCRFGSDCKESHDCIPYGFCKVYNDTGRCTAYNCRDKHELYNYNPSISELLKYYADEEEGKEGTGKFRST